MAEHKSTIQEKSGTTRSAKVDWSYGWRYAEVQASDGTIHTQRIPLTPEEALHPKEDYVMSERTSHTLIATELRNMLRVWSMQHPEMTIFSNLIFDWNQPEIGDYAPDIAVVPNVSEPEADRGKFMVAAEGTLPCLIIEVVSPSTQRADKVDKLHDYAQLGIREYVYIHSRTTRRGLISEIVGHRLHAGSYQIIPIDEDGAVYCETLSLRIGITNGRVWLEDARTGKEFLDHVETERAYTAAEERAVTAEERAVAESEARRLAEVRIAEYEAQIKALQEQIAASRK